MPHAEIKYSGDLSPDLAALFEIIEHTINRHDAGAGECKGRAYPSHAHHYPHLLVEVSMLTKPHRDEAFTRALLADLEAEIKRCLHQSCYFSLLLGYSPASYVTNEFIIDGVALPRYRPPGDGPAA